MCNQWEFKIMACGHTKVDLERVPCQAWDPSRPNECQIWYHPSPQVRSYTPGDGECRECSIRKAMAEQWLRAIGSLRGNDTHVAFVGARDYLFSLNFVQLRHIQEVQYELVMAYMDDGSVLDVDAVLRALGYDIPEVAFELGNEGQK
ncbi:hypothetical protein M434DRAFT_110741 [Hypoxylon sp. CO27-5]|nr:hypothetical protein M434DRAFT_110741 [Hypoxylon sp. CO27-5]